MIVKLATEPWEFEQIFNLNYSTFVEEIPQHQGNEERKLRDKFHDKNKYIIALENNELIGMIAFIDERPFSLDYKLENIDELLPTFKKPCEIRLLSIKKEHRGRLIFVKLFDEIKNVCKKNGYDIGVLSGTLLQIKMYEKIGCKPFGPLVGTKEAPYQPMYLTWQTIDPYLKVIEPVLQTKMRKK